MEVLNMPLSSFLFFYVLFAVEVVAVVGLGLYWYFKEASVEISKKTSKEIDS